MEEATTGILPAFLSDILMFLGVVLSLILLVVISYIWSVQRQDREDISKLSSDFKQLSKKVKFLEDASNEKITTKTVSKSETSDNESLFEDSNDIKKQPIENKIKPVWDTFLENYNHIAESMAVPGQLKACENFVADNDLKILVYTGDMKFVFVSRVVDSKFWAWRIEESTKYVVIPNPMITYDEHLHIHEGMKETFASNYENGKYTRYFVQLPAIFNYDKENGWKILEPGVIKLER